MFGVLVIRTPQKQLGFLAAFSGILDGSYIHPYFVPPVYNLQQPDGFFRQEEQLISALNQEIRQLESEPDFLKAQQDLAAKRLQAEKSLNHARIELKAAKAARDLQRNTNLPDIDTSALIRESQHQKAEYKRLEKYWKEQTDTLQNNINGFKARIEYLKTKRKQRSAQLQQSLFEQFRLLNARGEMKNVFDLFREEGQSNPPAGAGECAAPKLLQYAYKNGLQPIAMAEFWWGCSPKTEIRRQGNYYPACQGKCGPILRFMLQGLSVDTPPGPDNNSTILFPEIIYEDAWLLVVNKPEGMLTVPGKTTQPSVFDLVRRRYPEATGPLIVHRLDMATSGLLIIAKNKKAHQHLQAQFKNHSIRKKYIALLDGIIRQDQGTIELPLRPDPLDRPRQVVDMKHGKTAITHYQVLERTERYTRVAFYPHTGRTHQLRVHAAHPQGLHCPIIGDELYGKKNTRLYLHAESIEFVHPANGQVIRITKEAGFPIRINKE